MSAITPSTSYDSNLPTILPFDGVAGTYDTKPVRIDGLKMTIYHFASIATADEWTSGIHGVVKCFTSQNAKVLKVLYDDSGGVGLFTFTVTSGPATSVELILFTKG
jgi:hypothetical protein